MRFKGLLLKEGLKDETILDTLQITKRETWQVENAAPFQPTTWNPVWFEGEEELADEVAERLSQVLEINWYCNLVTVPHSYVIFGGKVFKYPRGDKPGKMEAQAHGRLVGIPESQLDWGEDYE